MRSLAALCAGRVAAQAALARAAPRRLPRALFPLLLRAGCCGGGRAAPLLLRGLLRAWPARALRLRPLLRPHGLRPHALRALLDALVDAVGDALDGTPDGEQQQHLQLLDVTGLPEDDPDGAGPRAATAAVAKACIAAAARQRAAAARGVPRAAVPPVELRADLCASGAALPLLREALRAGACGGGALRLRCRALRADELSAAAAAALLELLEPAGVRRVELRFANLGLAGLALLLPRLARFGDLVSLRLPYGNVDARRPPPGADLPALAAQLGALTRLKELDLGSSRLSGHLQLLLSALQGPLESLALPFCSLLPCDLQYLAQSPHALALRRLDLSGHNLSASLLPPFAALLAAAAASLLHLDLMECRLRDAQLHALLPPLRRCARLRSLGLFGNPLSTAALGALLLATAPLRDLRLVVYPYPVDCCHPDAESSESSSSSSSVFLSDGAVDEERLARAHAELQELLRRAGRADAVWTTSLSAAGVPDCIEL